MVWAATFLLLAASGARAQETRDWRAHFAAGEAARAAGDAPTYAREMAAAVEAMPDGLGNRPFAEYHAARASALTGDAAAAAGWLRRAWDEGIESLMITFADHDPAFDAVRGDPAFRAVMALPAAMTLTVRPLAPGLWLLDGAGSKLVASVGEDGVLLVDTGYGGALPALRRALAELGHPRIDALVLTHPHEDHWGAAAELGPEAIIYAHPRTAAAMDEPYTFMEGVELPPKPAAAHPDVLVRDTTFTFNGQAVRIVPVEAHTDADVAVYFAGAHVLHLGDAWLGGNPLFFPGSDEPEAFLDRVDAFLAGLPDDVVVVGGHDEPTDLGTVRAQIERTRACISLVRRAVSEGATLEETVERAQGRFTAPWVSFFYRVYTG